ncbi:MAG: VOC family protein [Pseudomonadota bacterium]
MSQDFQAPTGTRIGHVHLKVSNLERSIQFYRDVLGFQVQQRAGDQAAFLGADGYHHHIGLNPWQSAGQPQAPKHAPGLYHTAILYPDRAALAQAVARVVASGVVISGASDHGVSEAVYFDDPDGNGVELYRDRDPKDWPRNQDGKLAMGLTRLDVDALLAEAQ